MSNKKSKVIINRSKAIIYKQPHPPKTTLHVPHLPSARARPASCYPTAPTGQRDERDEKEKF